MNQEMPSNPHPGRGERSDRHGRSAARSSSKDITPILRGWDHEAGTINVRKVNGLDGTPKLQMRVDLGLLQMELTGRPDGYRPHGCESLLEFQEKELAEHCKRFGTDLGFEIDAAGCQSLREEAVMYYHRYLSLFVLEDFAGVVRDTARNLRLMDLCGQYAAEEHDRIILEQYRPYIIMMHARAKASIHMKLNSHVQALSAIEHGLKDIKRFYEQFDEENAYAHCNEVRVLKRFARSIRKKLPVDPVIRLQRKLDRAVKDERYEEAAQLRDKLKAMNLPEQPEQTHPRQVS